MAFFPKVTVFESK